jgi:hypothetical protein
MEGAATDTTFNVGGGKFKLNFTTTNDPMQHPFVFLLKVR